MILLDSRARLAMVEHALEQAPQEACGLVAGPPEGELLKAFFAVANSAGSATRFVLDPLEMLSAETRIEGHGLEVRGVMHSHPTTPARPSPIDVADAFRFDPCGTWLHLIVSLAGDQPEIGCFRIVNGSVEAVELRLR